MVIRLETVVRGAGINAGSLLRRQALQDLQESRFGVWGFRGLEIKVLGLVLGV